MPNYNKVLLMGRLTRDPEQRFISSGQSVTKIGLAINRNFTTSTNEKREEVTFIDAEAWGTSGETIHKYLKKGSPIFIEGRLKFDTWQTKEGEKRSALRVVVDRFEFVDSQASRGGGGGGGSRQPAADGGDISPQDFGVEGPPPSDRPPGESEVPF